MDYINTERTRNWYSRYLDSPEPSPLPTSSVDEKNNAEATTESCFDQDYASPEPPLPPTISADAMNDAEATTTTSYGQDYAPPQPLPPPEIPPLPVDNVEAMRAQVDRYLGHMSVNGATLKLCVGKFSRTSLMEAVNKKTPATWGGLSTGRESVSRQRSSLGSVQKDRCGDVIMSDSSLDYLALPEQPRSDHRQFGYHEVGSCDGVLRSLRRNRPTSVHPHVTYTRPCMLGKKGISKRTYGMTLENWRVMTRKEKVTRHPVIPTLLADVRA